MAYTVQYQTQALSDLKKLDKQTQSRRVTMSLKLEEWHQGKEQNYGV